MNRQEFRTRTLQQPLLLDAPLSLGQIRHGDAEPGMRARFAQLAAELCLFQQRHCDIVRCPSGPLNRFQLAACGLDTQTAELNRTLMGCCCAAVAGHPVFGTISTLGHRIEPYGSLDFEEAVTSYAEQGRALLQGGAQGFVLSGQADVQEVRAAIIALRELKDCPLIVELPLTPQGCVIGGTDPLSALITLQALQADAVGFIAADPGLLLTSLLGRLKPLATVPLYAVAPTGNSPVDYMVAGEALVSAGANLIGGNQETTAEQLQALGVGIHRLPAPAVQKKALSALSSFQHYTLLGPDQPFAVVGERINPTGKKKLQASLRQGQLDLVQTFALEQEQAGAAVLDVNMGLSGIDEQAMMLHATGFLSRFSPLPLCIDTTRPEVMEAALRRYPGRALVNSVSGERARVEETLPAAAKYGAMCIILPLNDAGIPKTTRERIVIVESVVEAAAAYGYSVADCVVDGLVMTISADPEAARVTLDLIEWCADSLQANTIVGLSNVSFGMPERQAINSAFLAMAMGRGLTMAIANPSAQGIMATAQSYNALWGHELTLLLNNGAYTPTPL